MVTATVEGNTGIDLAHPDLQGAFVPGYDVVNPDDDPNDDHGHGTMVAGVVAARANNHLGGVGICSRCSLMPVKVIAGNGSGNAADVAEGIRWAADHGARVINMSFTLSGPDENIARAIEYARGGGIVVWLPRATRAPPTSRSRPPMPASSASPAPTRRMRGTTGRATATECGSPRRAAARRPCPAQVMETSAARHRRPPSCPA